MNLTYLYINLGAFLIPFIFSFHPKIKFHKTWKPFWLACILTAAFFVAWDILYTHIGVWGFNSDYLTGFTLVNLPIEEVLFFICIPYSCLFTYHCFKVLMVPDYWLNIEKYITSSLITISVLLIVFFYEQLYTVATFSLLLILLILFKYIFQPPWLSRFYFTYFVLLIPFFIVNGLLTGTGLDAPVVLYDDAQNLGIRILSIPVEDIFYGMTLILINVSLYETFLSGTILNKSELPQQGYSSVKTH